MHLVPCGSTFAKYISTTNGKVAPPSFPNVQFMRFCQSVAAPQALISQKNRIDSYHILRGHQPGDLPPVGVDKWKARKGRWGIPEDSLIWLAVAGGSIGALGAMCLFRHKTRHLKFILGIPAILLLQVLLVFWLLRR